MTTKALGLIETIGLVAAIEAADSAVKAANVKLLGYENTKGGGRITIKIVGDVGAVKAAVSAGAAAGQRIGRVESCLVIPRPHHEIEALIGQIDRGPIAVAAAAAPVFAPEAAPVQEVVVSAPPAPVSPKAKAAKPKPPASKPKPTASRRSKAKPAAPPVEEERVVLLGTPAPVEEPQPPAEPEAPFSPAEPETDQPAAE